VKAGIIGLDGSGRETIFSALTGLGPGTGEFRPGEALAPDERLDYLSGLFKPKKHTPARLELVLVKPVGKTPAESLKVALEKSREMDVLIAVARAFPDALGEAPTPEKETATLESELLLYDYLTVEKRLERLGEEKKRGKKNDPEELDLLTAAHQLLEANQPLRLNPPIAGHPKLRGFGFLSAKPLLTLLNSPDDYKENQPATPDQLYFRGRLEAELGQLTPAEAQEFMADYGLLELGQARVIRKIHQMMELISFFTVGEDECRAWLLRRGQDALSAAGEIHSDIQKGFIRAEVVAFEDFKATGGFNEAKKKGVFRLEGKTYLIQDGDIVHFRFNV
jgi:ribosome-binding ATPase YchF (GTP1/OBG family)